MSSSGRGRSAPPAQHRPKWAITRKQGGRGRRGDKSSLIRLIFIVDLAQSLLLREKRYHGSCLARHAKNDSKPLMRRLSNLPYELKVAFWLFCCCTIQDSSSMPKMAVVTRALSLLSISGAGGDPLRSNDAYSIRQRNVRRNLSKA